MTRRLGWMVMWTAGELSRTRGPDSRIFTTRPRAMKALREQKEWNAEHPHDWRKAYRLSVVEVWTDPRGDSD